jgi:hypothetical protein
MLSVEMKGSSRNIFGVLYQQSPGGTEENNVDTRVEIPSKSEMIRNNILRYPIGTGSRIAQWYRGWAKS